MFYQPVRAGARFLTTPPEKGGPLDQVLQLQSGDLGLVRFGIGDGAFVFLGG